MEWTILSNQYALAGALVMLLTVMMGYGYYFKDKDIRSSHLEIGEESAIGNREMQEDAGGAVETQWGTLAVLADGRGKGQSGKIAALTTVSTLLELFASRNVTNNVSYFFNQAFNQSNREVLERLQGNKGAAVAVAVLISKQYLYYAGVGNMKIAVLRNQELIAINDGHTMKSAAVKGFNQGLLSRDLALEISKLDRQSNYIGRDGFKNIEIGKEPVKLNPGDIIVLINDGIFKCLSWVEIESILAQPFSCQHLAERIIEAFTLNPMPDKENAALFVLRYNGI